MTGSCLCGAVRIELPAPPPFIHDCDCTLCRKSGAAWGYFPADAVRASGGTRSFVRTDKPGAAAAVQHCPACGSTTHFVMTEAFRAAHPDADMVGVNMRLFAPDELAGIEVRFPDGYNWPGSGAFAYRRDAVPAGEGW